MNDSLPAAPPSHPEEMRAEVDLRIGKAVALRASARVTPAGLVSVGILVSAILLSVGALLRARAGSRAGWPGA